MHCLIDLRYAIPPLINITLLFLTFHDKEPWDYAIEIDLNISPKNQHPFMKMAFLFLAILLLLFILTSFKLRLTAQPVHLRVGDFSGSFCILLLASIMLAPSLFWVAFLLTPWYSLLVSVFKRAFCYIYHTLRAIPMFIVICITNQNQESGDQPLVDIERAASTWWSTCPSLKSISTESWWSTKFGAETDLS